ncbi:extracellular solute-binding protein family 5 [Methylobacterium sp. 4-46]|uniref:peptide ABC transporter substrate-binding protein n=1 Tax=unclassified Methylobacterium TaxID=2615210 RepID=UPI000152C1FA|nr:MULTISPECIES: peptide ABC transporter substrate-binding protein [Methylobacterium]ACA15442.1 extracellular solute-binding protein family 5 [Methylobacterium sp. 4-46]WFT81161.1 peptide ABC transporter substrate-binding protein [Methylobacterium nodulans]
MNERDLRTLIGAVKDGRLSRRHFVQRMIALGLTAPMAGMMLAQEGVAQTAEGTSAYKPAKAGGGGALKLLFWQAATLINPHFAVGTKDQEGSRIFYEPLAAWDAEGNLFPVLAAAIPSRQNGGVAEDGRSVTWKLKPGVTWHDGKPFSADDVVFTWQYAANPATAAVTSGSYKDIKVEKVDDLTVKVLFDKPTPFWADAFVSSAGMIIPKHHFEAYIGDKSRDAPANLAPVGTGPYKFAEFRPGDIVRGVRNPDYHMPNRPSFDTIEMKGGGDAVSAARAVLQTGEYDYAWNMQVEDEILKRLEAEGRGRVEIVYGGNLEFILLNATDPWTEVDGERASLKTKHPAFSDPAVRKAMNLIVNRAAVQQFIYGRTGRATANVLNGPERFRSKNTSFAFDTDKAAQILEEAGWKKGGDGIRAKDGKKLKFVYQTSINAPRQKTQAIVKQAAQKAGIDMELKSIPGSVFFSSDVANPDTYPHFYADMEMYTWNMAQADPGVFMLQYVSWEAATKENKWQGRNICRMRNDEADACYRAAQGELDAVKRAALFIKMNDIVASEYVMPLLHRAQVSAVGAKLQAPSSGWDNSLAFLFDWYKEA